MTDKERFIELMKHFGIPLRNSGRDTTETLAIEPGYKAKGVVEGRPGLSAEFVFCEYTGEFVRVGVWA